VDTVAELRQVIRRIERSRPPRPAPEPVEKILGGEVVETEAGRLLAVRGEVPLSARHGGVCLARLQELDAGTLGLLAPALDQSVDPRRLLFLDAETTGLSGGTGTYPFLVGVGYLEGDRLVITQYFMRDLDEEPALLAALAPLLDRASALVTFNGSGFDIPLLETRFVLQRRHWPVAMHVDLMRPARRIWNGALADCRLGTLERLVLAVERELDVPGFAIPQIYFDFLRRRSAGPLRRVLAHNRYDLLALAGLLGWFADAMSGGRADLGPVELAGLGRLWEGTDGERACACYAEALASGLDEARAHAVRLRLAWWEKRRARWEAACTLWEVAAQGVAFDPRPWEELAKFHEHRARDVAAARLVVSTALDRAEAARASGRVLEALGYRLARLERRLAERAPQPGT
jgi:uncharacterized protein